MYYYVVYDRDGDILAVTAEGDEYDTYAEAYKAGEFWDDDPRFGSIEVCSMEE